MTYTLYSMQNSGNCYKPRLLMHQLGLDFRLVDTDSFDGSTRTAAYLALNVLNREPEVIRVAAPAPAPAPAEPAIPTDDVLDVARDIPLAAVVREEDLSWQPWPRAAIA